ncbi:hypothetical protein M501DRAFT_389655 [Patellaria atrata CBS 101060]|uniref:Uncharacterized protein n=1 Tax=Patellaria atrata CBS 101060 TaxID=1346257 RepID=A0A9P4VQQ8_9PEZI|nr:hypothetical protein M501DRAFT_389655 [Patellaria atrata CBS 101060]
MSQSGSPSPTAAPSGEGAVDRSTRNLIIILSATLGVFLIILIIVIIRVCLRRRARRGIFLGRTVTPLDDATFESWRKPSMHVQRSEKDVEGLTEPTPPPMARLSYRSPSMEHSPEFHRPRTPSYARRPESTRSRERLHKGRRQSSVSIQDRPPTPYSPRKSLEEDASTWGTPQSTTQRPSHTHSHYPSVSDASDFDFGFSWNSRTFLNSLSTLPSSSEKL